MSVTTSDQSPYEEQEAREAAILGDTSLLIKLLDNGAPFIIDAVSCNNSEIHQKLTFSWIGNHVGWEKIEL